MKILVNFLIIFSVYIYAASEVGTNMDKKVYYDADRTVQDKFQSLSDELSLFINNEASDDLINQYKDGKLDETEINPVVVSSQNQNQNLAKANATTTPKVLVEEPSFFAKMLEKIGIGSTKKISEETTQDTPVVEEVPTEVITTDSPKEVTVESVPDQEIIQDSKVENESSPQNEMIEEEVQ